MRNVRVLGEVFDQGVQRLPRKLKKGLKRVMKKKFTEWDTDQMRIRTIVRGAFRTHLRDLRLGRVVIKAHELTWNG